MVERELSVIEEVDKVKECLKVTFLRQGTHYIYISVDGDPVRARNSSSLHLIFLSCHRVLTLKSFFH